MDEQLNRIAEKLGDVRRRWFPRSSFGWEKHHYELQPPVAEPELIRFEVEQGVRLPEEYRVLLLCMGNGGAGPGFGIIPLAEAAKFPQRDEAFPADYLARPCPLQPGMPRDQDWLERTGCADDEHYEERYQGTIAVAHNGCTYYVLLVVSGPGRGRLVNVCLDDQPPSFARDANFLDWYERWLDEVLKPRASSATSRGSATTMPERAHAPLRIASLAGRCSRPGRRRSSRHGGRVVRGGLTRRHDRGHPRRDEQADDHHHKCGARQHLAEPSWSLIRHAEY